MPRAWEAGWAEAEEWAASLRAAARAASARATTEKNRDRRARARSRESPGRSRRPSGNSSSRPAQFPLWQRYQRRIEDLLDDQMRAPHASDATGGINAITRKVDIVRNRLAAMEQIERSARALYAALTPEQQRERRRPAAGHGSGALLGAGGHSRRRRRRQTGRTRRQARTAPRAQLSVASQRRHRAHGAGANDRKCRRGACSVSPLPAPRRTAQTDRVRRPATVRNAPASHRSDSPRPPCRSVSCSPERWTQDRRSHRSSSRRAF